MTSTQAQALQAATLSPDPTDTGPEETTPQVGQFKANAARQQVLDGISALAPKEALGEEMDMMIPVPDAIPDRLPVTTRDT